MSDMGYITVAEAAKRLGCHVSTIYHSRCGKDCIVPGDTRPKLVNWDMLKHCKAKSVLGRPPYGKNGEESTEKPNPYWLRRGPTDSLGTSSSSLEAGAYIG